MIPENFADFYGDHIRWFVGEVVDIEDPLEMARVQIRAYGIHTGNETDIPEEDLPWAQVMAPISQGGTEGKGNFLGLMPEARVVGLFLDGQNSQVPMILGTLPKYEEESPGESNINQLAKGEQTYPYEPEKECFEEPEDPYDAKYPYNKVYETGLNGEEGHIKEFDDTEGAERIRERHKSGTFYQMNPDGSWVTHVKKDRYTVIVGDDYLKIEGDWKICLDTFTLDAREINLNAEETFNVTAKDINMTAENQFNADANEVNINAPNGDVDVGGVSLVNHTHRDNPGLAAGVTSPPIK